MRLMTLAFLFYASALTAADLPKYFAVHVDEVKDRTAYDRLDREYEATIAEFYKVHGAVAPALWAIATTDGAHFGLRPRVSLADLEKPPALGPELQKELNAKTAPLSEATHKTLIDHHNEIWRVEHDLTAVRSTAVPTYAILRSDRVRPGRQDGYEKAAKAMVDAITAKGVDVVTFWSVYGDGRQRYLVMSSSPIDLRRLAGADRLRALDTCVLNTNTAAIETSSMSADRWMP